MNLHFMLFVFFGLSLFQLISAASSSAPPSFLSSLNQSASFPPGSLFLSVFASNGSAALLTPSPLIDGQQDLPLSRLLSPLRPVITCRLFRCPTVRAHHTNSRVCWRGRCAAVYTHTHTLTTAMWVFLSFQQKSL